MNESQTISMAGSADKTPALPHGRRVLGTPQELDKALESIPTQFALNPLYVPPVAVGEPLWREVYVVDLAVAYPNLLLASG
jgi:hypothetical protein